MRRFHSLFPDDLPQLLVERIGPNLESFRLTLRDRDATALETVNGPPMIEHPSIRSGRPTSLFDIMGCYEWQKPITIGLRVVPADRNFDAPLPHPNNRHLFELVSVEDLHREWTTQVRWRGRPSAFTMFNLNQLIQWRDDVFTGDLTIRELAKRAEVSEPAASRFAHGETLWYV